MSAFNARPEPVVGHAAGSVRARLPKAGSSKTGRSSVAVNLFVWAGCALLAGSAVIHFYLWNSHGYSHIPTIGPLFLAQAIVGAVVALLTAATRRLLLVVVAAGLLVSSIGGLLVSIWWGLFGWQETASAPYVGLALWVEALGAASLGTAALVLGLPWLASQRGARRHGAAGASRPTSTRPTGRGLSSPGA